MVALLDVNVLVALFESTHIHHQIAHDWFDDQRDAGWATCPLTENGLLRIATNRSFQNPQRAVDVLKQLAMLRNSGGHHFWPDTLSIADEQIFNPAFIVGHRQVTDIYLLGLATSANGAFVTFDRSVPLAAVKGATAGNLQVLERA